MQLVTSYCFLRVCEPTLKSLNKDCHIDLFIFYTHFYAIQCNDGGVESIPAVIGWEVGFPGQATGPLQGQTTHMQIYSDTLQTKIKLTWMFLDCRRQLENLEKTHTCVGWTYKLHTEKSQVGFEGNGGNRTAVLSSYELSSREQVVKNLLIKFLFFCTPRLFFCFIKGTPLQLCLYGVRKPFKGIWCNKFTPFISSF